MANPLVAEVQDSTTAISGVPILESISETSKAIESGDWAAGVMGAAGTALDALGMAMDPFGSILAAGVGWLIEHVGPLSDALDALTGNADEIKAHSETWKNVGTELSSISADLAKMIEEDTASWTGPAGDAYRTRGADTATLIAGAQTAAEGASSGIGTAGEVVGAVRSLVRDIIAELVGHMISWALQVLFTLGIGMAWVVPQVISAVAKTAMKIADITKKLVQALSKLSPLLKKLGDSFGDAAKKLKDIKGGKKPDANTAKGDNNGGTSASSAGPTPNSPPGQSNGHGGGGNNGSSSNNDGPTPNTSSSSSSNNSSSNGNSSTNSSSANNNTRPDAVGKDNRECVTDPVDVMTGEVVTTEVDLTLHGFTLERTHISSYRAGRGFGANWASTVDQRLELGDGVIRFFTADGMALVYPTPNGTALPIDGPRWPLTADGPGYRIDDPLGEQSWFFAPVPGTRPAVRPLVAIERDHLDRIEIEHDGLGTPVLLRHNAGSTIRLSTEQQRVTGIEVLDETGQSVQVAQFGYDDRSRLATVVNSSGTPLKYEYDPQGRLTGWQDRTGTWYRYTYNADGRCVATTGPDGFYSGTLSYDRDQLITTYTDSLGASTEYHFTAARQLSRRVGPSGDVVAYEWDRYDHLLSRTDPLGATTSFTYDERGALATVTRPDGSVLDVTQDAGGLTIGIEENGTRITRFYPAEEAPDPFEDTLGISAPTSYEQLAATNPANADDSGRPQDRDVFGRVKAELNKSQQPVVLGWTVEGQERLRVQPSGVRQTRRHDAEGREIEHVNGAGVTTRTEYGAFGLVTATIDGTGARTSYTYDTELRLASMTNPLGLTWTYRYDPAGRLAEETDYDGRTLAFTYDRAGRLTESSNGDGQRTAYRYDALGNVVERQSPTGTTRYTYDALGRLTSAVLGDAELTITHDAIGTVTAESVNGRTVTRVRDADGALRRRTPSGVDSEWRFDSAGAPVSLVIAGHTIRFEHDSGGREITRIVDGRVTISQSFDADENLVAQAVQAEAAPPRQRRYTYRADGLLSGIDDDVAGSTRYALDAAGRVTGVQAPRGQETYRYDAAGNVVEEAFGVRQYSRNTLVSAGAATFEYDRQGRMTTRREGDRVWRYVWDGHDRLIALATPHGEQWLYRYDPLGRRIGKQRMATSPAGAPVVAETYEFTWTGALLAEQVHVDARGTRTVTTWEYRPGDDHPVAQVEQTSDVDSRFLAIVSDLLGRPVELLDAAGGLAWRENARLWGHEDGPAATPLRFPGQYADAESGLHYNVFRFYDPVLGRYLSQDPLGLGPAPNPVAYVDNPLVAADPLGLVCKPKSGTPDRPGAGGDASNVPGTRSPDTNRTTAGQARNNWKKKIREIRTSLVGSGSRPGKMDQAPSNNPGGGGPHESFNVSSLSTNPNQPNVDLLVHRPNGYINGFTRPDPANPNQTQAWTYPGNNAMSAAPPGAQQNILQGNNVNPNYSSSGGVGKLNVGQQSMNDALHTLGTSNNPQQLSHAIHTMSVNVMEPARMNGVANQVQNTFSGPGWQNASSPLPSAQQSQINNWGNSSQDWGGVHKPDSSHLNMHLGNNPDKPGPNSNPLNRR